MNKEVIKFIDAFQEKMRRTGKKVEITEIEALFLDQVFGPEFNYNFAGLVAQLHFKDYKGKNRRVDFYYEAGIVRLILEIDSHEFHVERPTPDQYDEHMERQNDLVLSGGWLLLRFTAGMIRKKPMICRRQLVQAVGKCIVMAQQCKVSTPEELWHKRRGEILLLARSDGMIRVPQVASRFNIHRKTAARWLQRMAAEHILRAVQGKKYITAYTVTADSTTGNM